MYSYWIHYHFMWKNRLEERDEILTTEKLLVVYGDVEATKERVDELRRDLRRRLETQEHIYTRDVCIPFPPVRIDREEKSFIQQLLEEKMERKLAVAAD